MHEVTRELKLVKMLLLEIGFDHKWQMTIRCHSKPAIHISLNPIFHGAQNILKSIIIQFVMRFLEESDQAISCVYMKDQMTNILTKVLGRKDNLTKAFVYANLRRYWNMLCFLNRYIRVIVFYYLIRFRILLLVYIYTLDLMACKY